MDTTQVKQIVEAIKTINLNINSDTGVKAVEAVANKIGFWLIMREVFYFIEFLIGGIVIVIIGLLAYKIILKQIKANRDKELMYRLSDYENLTKEDFKEIFK